MDFASLLIWLAGPGLAVISAFILERLQPFDELSSNGKVVVSITVAGILGLLAVAAQQIILPNAELVAQLNPYVAMLVPLFSLLAQQLAHGATKARRVDVEWDSDDDDADDEAA